MWDQPVQQPANFLSCGTSRFPVQQSAGFLSCETSRFSTNQPAPFLVGPADFRFNNQPASSARLDHLLLRSESFRVLYPVETFDALDWRQGFVVSLLPHILEDFRVLYRVEALSSINLFSLC